MRAAVCGPAVCISDVIDKTGMCGKNIKHVTSQPFSALHQEATQTAKPTWLHPENLKFEEKKKKKKKKKKKEKKKEKKGLRLYEYEVSR